MSVIYALFDILNGNLKTYCEHEDEKPTEVDLLIYTWFNIDIEIWNIEYINNNLLPDLDVVSEYITWVPRS